MLISEEDRGPGQRPAVTKACSIATEEKASVVGPPRSDLKKRGQGK
ncbi:hypothetical protein DFJ67_0280 [Asanoa ferruginea]|uniref:Uncharacterized protein n=1 Tax=Asanoa ferruginea TaxID=53367 RepID=A0A3D9ZAK2_9ACTN|nr:hypothetical protein DFJ67_0280 [Asanoa ferruginea]GIF51126.1 hypothetical protein Afe04nite_56650 [Asanoa ferruginea]